MQPFRWHALWEPRWHPGEVALRATFIWIFVQVLMRLVGRKELNRYSTFDIALLFLISTAARQSIVGDDTSVTSAMVGLATIFTLEWLFSVASYRSGRIREWLEGPRRRLVRDGRLQEDALARARITRDQLVASLRYHGTDDLGSVKDAYLERSGQLTFVFWPAALRDGRARPTRTDR